MCPAPCPLPCRGAGSAARALLCALICVLALHVGPTDAHGALPPAATEDHWLEARSARFRVYSNADAAVAAEVARHLERFADVLRMTASDLRVESGREIRLYVFRDLPSFKPYRSYGDDDEGGVTAGFHVSGGDVEYIAFFVPEQRLPMEFATHEYLHAVISTSLGELPVWLNEGLAEFYSTFETGRRSAEIGRAIPGNLGWLREHMLPLSRLLLVSTTSPEYRQGGDRRTVYAQSWALAHALLMDPVDPIRFRRLVAELMRGATSIDALRLAYGPGAPDSLERRLREYVSLASLPARSLEFSESFDKVPVAIRALDRIEARTVLGELLLHAKAELAPMASEHLEAAWAADSTRTLPAALLGAMAERRGDRAVATRWFSVVQRSDPGESRALGLAGSALARRRLHTREPLRWPGPGAGADALQARAMLTRALENWREGAEWLTPYAMTFLDDSGDVREGIGALLQAEQVWPRRPEVVGTLSVLNLRSGNRGAALAAYQRIPPGPDHDFWAASAGHLIKLQTIAEARRLSREGQSAEAESLVVRLRRTVTESGVASDCDETLALLRGLPAPQAQGDGRTAPGGGAPGPSSATRVPALTQAQRDAFAADARNRKRLRSAEALVANGSAGLACALYDLILGDRPSRSMRQEVERRKARYCAPADRP